MRLFLFFLILVFALAGLSELAFAENIYSFRFQKKPAAPAAATVPTSESAGLTPTPKTPVTLPASASASAREMRDETNEAVDRAGWVLGGGFGAKAVTRGFMIESGYSVLAGYRFSKYIGADATFLIGHGKNDGETHTSVLGGARVTPLHLKLFDFDLVDVGVLVGLLTGRSEQDPGRLRLAPYIGFGVSVNISDRYFVSFDTRYEEGETDLYQSTFNGIYRF